jgi:hypothetical protein
MIRFTDGAKSLYRARIASARISLAVWFSGMAAVIFFLVDGRFAAVGIVFLRSEWVNDHGNCSAARLPSSSSIPA